jgi:hypothetical protein
MRGADGRARMGHDTWMGAPMEGITGAGTRIVGHPRMALVGVGERGGRRESLERGMAHTCGCPPYKLNR